jgi:hypothetical protein
MINLDKTLSAPVHKSAPTRGYKPLSGPCVVVEHKRQGWRVRFGHYTDDEQAKRFAEKSNKARKDGAKARAGRWEDAK